MIQLVDTCCRGRAMLLLKVECDEQRMKRESNSHFQGNLIPRSGWDPTYGCIPLFIVLHMHTCAQSKQSWLFHRLVMDSSLLLSICTAMHWDQQGGST